MTALEGALAEMVRAARRKRRLTVARFSERAGCEFGTVFAVENGEAESKPFGEIKRIVRELDIEVTFGGRNFHVVRRPSSERQAFRRWHWRTWNLLLQIQKATDGFRGKSLCVAAGRPDMRALSRRGWVKKVGESELVDDDDKVRALPAWQITAAGRQALGEARELGVEIQ